MNYTLIATLAYLTAAIGMTYYVGRTLRIHGRPFLEEAFQDKPELADAINVLLNTGFYLLNFGIIGASLKYALEAKTFVEAINVAGYRLGLELLTIGVIHFFNMRMINKVRKGEPKHRPAPKTEALA
ncbi:hypothetical protein IEN85_14115 [Pelagicoccus sp. NFK12]|uniref:Uncharacterized protein n=1 Tax=Pelagicoccus enzymogenes TaxID=2773457 RepID=A0A927FBZ0_9BACT|nr:hypothetical protein [Pelagicoccus enzymogenes]MBD5780633.1 hypothetical protein [Pelagicoccus enzymogenes]MDQ8198966.1 hypothetical protein [Pelagicoccus enzymogenes]